MMHITINGRAYRVEIEADVYRGAPWDEDCGHGPVSDWTSRAKAPGELVLDEGRDGKRYYYGYSEACAIARRDGWSTAGIEARKARGERVTPRQQAAEAARADYKYLRSWCEGRWHYVGVIVTGPDDEQASLWGIESDAEEGIAEVAQELAEELHEAYKAAKVYAYEG